VKMPRRRSALVHCCNHRAKRGRRGVIFAAITPLMPHNFLSLTLLIMFWFSGGRHSSTCLDPISRAGYFKISNQPARSDNTAWIFFRSANMFCNNRSMVSFGIENRPLPPAQQPLCTQLRITRPVILSG
jgi:hypothetical protein